MINIIFAHNMQTVSFVTALIVNVHILNQTVTALVTVKPTHPVWNANLDTTLTRMPQLFVRSVPVEHTTSMSVYLLYMVILRTEYIHNIVKL